MEEINELKNFFSNVLLESSIRFSKYAQKGEKKFLEINPRIIKLQENYDDKSLLEELANLTEEMFKLNDIHNANVTASIMNIVSYLEARINQFIDDFTVDSSITDECIICKMKDYREKMFEKKERVSIEGKQF